ncbi:MAG: peroxiredoxin [Deltaproteobacteria bacterium]|jgi:peroxiredoxin Q/BCP|nr:peroxiredoxin [Deltaproteobacteria bacterium]
MLETGRKFPSFTLPDARGAKARLKDFVGSWAVIYFYSKISTSGCSLEAHEFDALLPEFEKLGTAVAGVSPDTPGALCKAADKNSYALRLLSDPEHKLLEAAGVWQKKMLYGKEHMGVVRTTALVDPSGKVRKLWSKVKPQGHAQAVLEALKEALEKAPGETGTP